MTSTLCRAPIAIIIIISAPHAMHNFKRVAAHEWELALAQRKTTANVYPKEILILN